MKLSDDAYVLELIPNKDEMGEYDSTFTVSCITSERNKDPEDVKYSMVSILRLAAQAISIMEEDQDFLDFLIEDMELDEQAMRDEEATYTDNILTFTSKTEGSA